MTAGDERQGKPKRDRAAIEDRALGALLGLAVGDAFGTTLEFCNRDSYQHLTDMMGGGPFELAAGQWDGRYRHGSRFGRQPDALRWAGRK